jgi:hypothetical protein
MACEGGAKARGMLFDCPCKSLRRHDGIRGGARTTGLVKPATEAVEYTLSYICAMGILVS